MTGLNRAVVQSVIGLSIIAQSAIAHTTDHVAAIDKTVLVELFTSEGCSSCPPADRLLAEFVQHSPVPGVSVIALSEHVDYWDGLGWRDPFSNKQFTARQDRYAARFGPDKLYTPQMVVDGVTEFVGSDRRAAISALTKAAARAKADVRVAWQSTTAPYRLAVDVSSAPTSDVWMAVTEDGLTTDVKRGENAGKSLPHTGVTRSLKKIGETSAAGAFSMTPSVSVERGWSVPALRVVVFVQATYQGTVSGASALRFAAAEPLPLVRR